MTLRSQQTVPEDHNSTKDSGARDGIIGIDLGMIDIII